MSAIAAAFLPGAEASGALIARMLAAMAHRGPDHSALHVAGPAALGHNLLRTARAGLHLALDGSVVSFDGRLDAREPLAERLGIPAAADDAALVLTAYRRWGPGCAAQLAGDFAYALWDARARRLVCTRDKFGVRPLVYCDRPHRFLAASEGKALLAAGAPPESDDLFLADMLAGRGPTPDRTAYAAIRRLAPTHNLIVDAGGILIERYWSLPVPAPMPRGEAPAAFRAALAEAVRCRTIGPAPVGALLSGGLDSSSLTCLAAPLAPPGEPLRTYSLVYDRVPQHNERPYIETVLARVPARPRFIDAHRLDPFADAAGLLATHEGPILAPNIANIRLLHERAAADGTRILLDGHGGDEVVSFGHGRLSELAAARAWRPLWQQTHALCRAEGMPALPALRAILHAALPARRLRAGITRRLRPRRPVPAPPTFLDPAFAAHTRLVERHAAPARVGAERKREAVQHHALLTDEVQPLALELHDRSAAAAGIEVRFPFWDERVIAVALAADPADKLDAGWTRRLLRTAMDGILPPEIQWRRDKLDFSPHLLRHLIADDAGGAVPRLLFDAATPLAGIADLAALGAAHERLIAAHASGGACDGFDLQGVWRAVMTGLWLEQSRDSAAIREAAE